MLIKKGMMNGINFNLYINDLSQIYHKIKLIRNKYISYFRSKTHSADTQSFQYIQGKFIKYGRGNMVKYSKIVPNCNNQSLHNTISNSSWDHRLILNKIQRDVTELIGDSINGSIHIDKSRFVKKGTELVGVKRQYCDRLGKLIRKAHSERMGV